MSKQRTKRYMTEGTARSSKPIAKRPPMRKMLSRSSFEHLTDTVKCAEDLIAPTGERWNADQ